MQALNGYSSFFIAFKMIVRLVIQRELEGWQSKEVHDLKDMDGR